MRNWSARWRFVVLTIATLVVVVVGWRDAIDGIAAGSDLDVLAAFTGVVLALAVPGLVAEWRRPKDPVAWLVVVVGLAAGVSGYRFLEGRWISTVGAAVFLATPLAACHLVLAHPDGLTARARRRVFVGCWALPVVLGALVITLSGSTNGSPAYLNHHRRPASWAYTASLRGALWHQGNPLHLADNDAVLLAAWSVWSALVVGVGAATAVTAFRRRRRAVPADRRRTQLFALASVAQAIALLAAPLMAFPEHVGKHFLQRQHSVLQNRSYTDIVMLAASIAAAVLGAVVVWSELVQPRLRRRVSGAIPIERFLALDDLVQRSLGDPSARVVFPADDGRWVDRAGRDASLDLTPGRAVTTVTRTGVPVAAITHDSWLSHQPDLVDVTIGTIALTLESQRLAAVSLAATTDIRASSQRLLYAADDARRVVVDAIDRGPVRTLDRVVARFDEQPVPFELITEELRVALEQLREIAHELAPVPELASGAEALTAMLAFVGERCDRPFTLVGVPDRALPPSIVVTIYLFARQAALTAQGPISVAVVLDDAHDVTVRISGWTERVPRLLADRLDTLRGTYTISGGELVANVPIEGE